MSLLGPLAPLVLRRLSGLMPPQVGEVEWLRAEIEADQTALAVDPAGPIPAEVRAGWLRTALPDHQIEVPSEGADAELIEVPPAVRGIDPIELRADPLAHWDHLAGVARPDYLVRVAVVGPESVGKSTLARDLARHFGGVDVQEYGRDAYPWADPDYVARPEHMVEICAGHAELIRKAALQADRYLFSDTEALVTRVWSELYLGEVPAGVERALAEQHFDLFLLLDVDVPWVDDGTRTWAHVRDRQFETLRATLEARELPFRVVSGDWESRLATAIKTVARMGPPSAPLGSDLPRFPEFDSD